MTTPFHSQFFAYDLTRRRGSEEQDKFAGALVDAQVDLNPHQVQAALFAFENPLSGGAILADEVGLGKTIEAGLIISQKWAEYKRQIIIITPANLRKQWLTELGEKFFLPAQILETASFNAALKAGQSNPFQMDSIVVCSYQFAARRAQELRAVHWDLVVMDEAHRLRNVYKTGNIIGKTLKKALEERPKLLLTATPLQNSLLELYGLVSLLSDQAFGDVGSFREQFSNLGNAATFDTLKSRLKPFCHRTLRKQVTQYVNYTQRHVLVEEFTPHANEQALYDRVSEFLQRPHLASLPSGQRSLMTLILRKLLASSSFAIAGALGSIHARFQREFGADLHSGNLHSGAGVTDALADDYETLDETAEEWPEDQPTPMTPAQREQLGVEAAELDTLHRWAQDIQENAKGQALLTGLKRAFEAAQERGAQRKAIVFTESRRTQDYLLNLLEANGYAGKIVLFNGTNSDPRSKATLKRWQEQHKGSDRLTGSRTADMRSALVDEFRQQAEIMIATEAGAEGINLQFCSLVVNYDLPWNPQRIEQRIGRCHRYGQKHDVVVLNFLNKGNEADGRVYELLTEKFKLFEGVFGSSDEVIGAIGSGVDFEKRVADIYQQCRTSEEIRAAFDALQASLSQEISDTMTRTRAQLLENFDEEVHAKLKMQQDASREQLDRFGRHLMNVTRTELGEHATFEGERRFTLHHDPTNHDLEGIYYLPRRDDLLRETEEHPQEHRYRLMHPLAEYVLGQAKTRDLSGNVQHLTLKLADAPIHIGSLKGRAGESGWLRAALYTVQSLGQTEEHLLLSVLSENGEVLSGERAQKLLEVPGTAAPSNETPPEALSDLLESQRQSRKESINARNLKAFEDAANRIDTWSEDLKLGLERDIKELDRQIKEARRAASLAPTLQAKLDGQKQVQELEKERTRKRRNLFDEQDRIDDKRQELIDQLSAKMQEHEELRVLFTVKWSLE